MGQSSPPKQSESRQRHLIAPSCGCLLFSATFSGRIWTSRKTPIKTGGTMMNANHAMTSAIESSVSPWNMEACADCGSNNVPSKVSGSNTLQRLRGRAVRMGGGGGVLIVLVTKIVPRTLSLLEVAAEEKRCLTTAEALSLGLS